MHKNVTVYIGGYIHVCMSVVRNVDILLHH